MTRHREEGNGGRKEEDAKEFNQNEIFTQKCVQHRIDR